MKQWLGGVAGLRQRAKQKVRDAAKTAARNLAESETGGTLFSEAVRRVQEGRHVIDERAGQLVNSLGLATTDDVVRLGRRMGKLRKRLQALLDDLEA